MFAGFYVLCMWRCWIMMQRLGPNENLWYRDCAQMTIASLCGFGVAAQFVSLEALEVPYYVALLGAGTLVLHSRQQREQAALTPEYVSSFQPSSMESPLPNDWRDAIDLSETMTSAGDWEQGAGDPGREQIVIMN